MHQSIVFCSACTMYFVKSFTFAISSPDEFHVTFFFSFHFVSFFSSDLNHGESKFHCLTRWYTWQLCWWNVVWIKKSSHPKTFCNIFIWAKYISEKFCRFVASIYPHMSTNFGWFIVIFNKIALIFLGVLILFTVSSFEFQQVRLPWLPRL